MKTKYKHTIRAHYEFVDVLVLMTILFLAGLGILTVFSITGTPPFNNATGDHLRYMRHSTIGVIIGLGGLVIATLIPNKVFLNKWFGYIVVISTILMLILTPIIGVGTIASPDVRRWIRLPGGATFQAIDVIRLGFTYSIPWLIIHLIDKNKYYDKKIISWYLIPLVAVAIATFFVVLQLDLGSAIVTFSTGLAIFFTSGLHKKQLMFIIGGGVLLISLGFLIIGPLLLSYMTSRIDAWMNPFTHPFGHQSVMGFVSIALGGWFGVGIGQSTQTLGFAIEAHTDMIITIISEEFGFITVLLVMLAYLFIAYRSFSIALKARDLFSALVCIGIGMFFLAQPFVNLGGASGFIPLSGVALPIVSFGMTNKISSLMLIGIYFNMRRKILVDIEREKKFKMRSTKEAASNVIEINKNPSTSQKYV